MKKGKGEKIRERERVFVDIGDNKRYKHVHMFQVSAIRTKRPSHFVKTLKKALKQLQESMEHVLAAKIRDENKE